MQKNLHANPENLHMAQNFSHIAPKKLHIAQNYLHKGAGKVLNFNENSCPEIIRNPLKVKKGRRGRPFGEFRGGTISTAGRKNRRHGYGKTPP
ncbi:hypothetical protein [Tranquillimonas alkanivorans]|uniref:Uncharacterized protein n=1 Tax=Tranquillimonas alkanivorans TaxID=441119 RepID=A0A1I5VCI2_9RHOB|nr:hypothetical protein [Tranquillimonas alkanivorans]SFQ05268.1 hypothetical protein SAMN04488047_12922 [Tranquillimonas alkanivorans]